jgi:hypothetical protein
MAKYAASDREKDRRDVRFRREEQPLRRKYNALLMLIVAAALFVLLAGKQVAKRSEVAVPPDKQRAEVAFPDNVAAGHARDYVRAVQEENWARIFEMTQWMQRRVEHIRAESGSETVSREIENFYRQEKEDFFAASNGPSLTENGISDAHLFPSGASVRVVEVHEGLLRPILSKSEPVHMVVLEVEYPLSVTAPMAPDEIRIDTLRASLYLTSDGQIIKASVRGNARVDADSVLARRLTSSETRRFGEQAGEPATEAEDSSG